MAYMHIDNLYKTQEILMFKECYAMEKIHGTSAHISYKDGEVKLFAGGGKHEAFLGLFDIGALKSKFSEVIPNGTSVYVYGESYGGKQQGMSNVYGKEGRFVAFEVRIGESWLNVEKAHGFVDSLGLEFVHYEKISTTLEAIDAQRDAPSMQAERNGMGEHGREGIVLRPLEEATLNSGRRVMAKHKRDEYMETKTTRTVDPGKLAQLAEAKAIANEWVTQQRLIHVIDKAPFELAIENIGKIIPLMTEDILREAEGEIIDSPNARKEMGRVTALLVKQNLHNSIKVC